MINKVLFLGDMYRGNQDRNIQILYYLISPVFSASSLKIQIVNNKSQNIWTDTLQGIGKSLLQEYDLNNTLVISFEMNILDKEFLNQHNIPWIDLEIHPIRFLDDLYFSITSSFDFDFDKLAISKSSIQLYANNIRISNIDNKYQLHNNSLLILGQEPEDKSVYFDHKFKVLLDYEQELNKLVQKYDNVYFRPHPFKTDETINNIMLKKYNASKVSDINYYELISDKRIKGVCAISSSTIHEAIYFDKEVTFLEKRIKQFSKPIRLDKFLNCRTLWHDVLSIEYSDNDFSLSENKCRDFFSYWSYKTNSRALEDDLNSVKININKIKNDFHKVDYQIIKLENKLIEKDVKLEECKSKVEDLWQTVYQMTASNSFKLTKVFMFIKKFLVWFVVGVKHWITFSPSSRPRRVIIPKIRTFLYKYPKVKNFVRSIFSDKFITNLNYQKNQDIKYKSFILNNTLLHFCLGPLEDKRGIGRVAREQYAYLEKNFSTYKDEDFKNEVYFFTSIHWCPEKLKDNTIIMIHDVTPLVLEELFPNAKDEWNNKFKNIVKQAKKIITISQNSKNDIVKFLDINKDNIEVIHNGVSKLPIAQKSNYSLPKYYFVYLGAYDNHKNLDVLFRALINSSYHLVLIGDNLIAKQRAKQLGLASRVHFLGKLEDKEIGFILKNAVALLFPSLYEGFGLPPMEAALLNTPSICSNRPTMTEFLKDVVLFADPHKEDEWLAQMNYIYNEDIRKIYAKNVYEEVSKLTWQKSCKTLFDSIQQ